MSIDKDPTPPNDSQICGLERLKGQDVPTDLKPDQAKAIIGLLQADVVERENRNKYRFPFAIGFGIVGIIWLSTIATIIFLDGSSVLDVDEKVILGLLGTSIVNVLAPAHLIAKYLFPGQV